MRFLKCWGGTITRDTKRVAVLDAPSVDALGLTPGRFIVHSAEDDLLSRKRLVLTAGLASDELTAKIADEYNALTQEAIQQALQKGVEITPADVSVFRSHSEQLPDTEVRARLEDSVSGADVFVCSHLHNPHSGFSVNDALQELIFMGRAAKSHGARRVFAVLPKLAYDRQDKETPMRSQNGEKVFGNYREGLAAKIVADQIKREGKYDGVITLHPHSAAAIGFYEPIVLDPLSPIPVLGHCFSEYRGRSNFINVAVDEGAIKLTETCSDMLDWDMAIALKTRLSPREVSHGRLIGEFEGKTSAVIMDDIMATGGSVVSLVNKLRERGLEEFYLAISHPTLTGEVAFDRLQELHELGVQRVYFTDSVPQPRLQQAPYNDFVEIVPLARYFARVINARYNNQSAVGMRGMRHQVQPKTL